MQVCWISPDSMPSVRLVDWMDGQDMIEIPIWRLIFLNFHLLRLFRLFGMEHLCSLEGLLRRRSNRKINILSKLCLIKVHKLYWPLQVRAVFWSVQQFVHIWDVFQFHIWVITMDGCVSVMVQCMISLVGFDKGLLFKIYHILTTQFMRMVHWFVLRHWNSQDNHHKDSGLDWFKYT